MTFTPIAQGIQHWAPNVNSAFQDLQDQETAHTGGVDPHGDRAYADSHITGATVSGTPAAGRALGATGASTIAWSDTKGTGPWVFNIRSYGAVGDGKVVVDGAMTNGSATLTSATASFTMADVGKVIQVKGAAATGVTSLVTTIQAYTSATTVTLTAAASTTVTGAQVMWGTDDTNAVQAAINAAVTYASANAGVATVFVAPSTGFYAIGGALVTGGTTKGNAQLTLPVIPVTGKKIVLTIEGATNGAAVQHWLQTVPQYSGALVSFGVFTSIGGQSASITANGNPSVLSGPLQPGGYGTSALLYSNMLISLRDLSILTTHSAYGLTYTAFDFSGVACAELNHVAYGTAASVANSDYATPGQFSTGLSMGAVMPANGNNDAVVIDSVVCHGGYTWAFVATEHAVINRMVLLYSWSALGVTGSYNTSVGASHAFCANQLSVEGCSNVIYIFGQGAAGIGPFIDIVQLDTEVGAPTFMDNGSGAGLQAALGTVRLTGLYTPANISTGGLPTGLVIIDGQNPNGVRSVSTTASVRLTDRTILGNTTSAGFTVTLLSAVANQVPVQLRNTGSANTLTIACVGGQTIDGSATKALTTGQSARLVSNGANWFTV